MPSGAGTAGAGIGPAGFEILPTSDSTVAQSPIALLFDPRTRDYRLGADGRFVAVHPVDQETALALSLTYGDVGSTSNLGNRLRRIARLGGPSLQSGVEDLVRQALARLLDRKAIALLDITVQNPARGQLLVAVTYVNLMLQPPRTAQLAQFAI